MNLFRKKTPHLIIVLFLLPAILLSSCARNGNSTPASGEMTPDLSHALPTEDNNRVFYEIFVGSFSDSDGDGIGDLKGIRNRLDYLNDGDPAAGDDLGVEGLWLTPIFYSPSYHKYDVQDFYTIDPQFGSMEDLKDLLEDCHSRNIEVILDLPINHTSSWNAWFDSFRQAHEKGLTDDPYYDFYSWHGPDEESPSGRTFLPLGYSADSYECNFSPDMPELNFDCPAVREAVLDVAKYYLDLGVDGFRFDAAKYIYYGQNDVSSDFWVWYTGELRSVRPDIYMVAEVWDSDVVIDTYTPVLNCFQFSLAKYDGLIAQTARNGNVGKYTTYVASTLEKLKGSSNPDAMLVPFLTNHDLDRAAGFLSPDTGAMQMAANLYILSPGSPFIYYGEEIGIRGSRGSSDTDANRRLAMLWGDGDTVADPVGADYPAENQISSTVHDQLSDPDSLLSYYRKLLLIRYANPEIARGTYTALSLADTKAGGFMATWQDQTVCVLHNTTNEPVTVDLSTAAGRTFSEISAFIGTGKAALDGTSVTLDAMTSVVLR